MERDTTFEARIYFSIPHSCTRELIDVARALLAIQPDDGPVELDRAAEDLRFRADKAEARLDALGVEHDAEAEQREVDFEDWTDALASTIHGSFGHWSLFELPGYAQLAARDPKIGAKLPEQRRKAARARAICEGMFGEDGLDFFRLQYPQRARTLAAMLRTVAADDIGGDFEELLPPALAQGRVKVLSEAYNSVVGDHLQGRDEARSLGKHRVALRWALAAYAHEVAEMADRYSQESCDRSNAALQPLVDACKVRDERRRARREANESEPRGEA